MGMPVQNLSQSLDLSACPQLARGVVRIGDHHKLSARVYRLFEVIEVEMPITALIRVHRARLDLSTRKFHMIDVL